MKNLSILIFAILIILAHGAEEDYLPGVGSSNPTQISYNDQIITATQCVDYTLSAGSTFMDYGTVRVCNKRDELYIGVYADQGFIGTDTVKIWIGTSLNLLPLPKQGARPIPGKFYYRSPEFTDITYYWSFSIAFNEIIRLDSDPVPSCEASNIFVYVHVDTLDGNTGWGGSQCIGSGSKSAWYCSITYVTKCPSIAGLPFDCSLVPLPSGCPTYTCDTAFAYGNYLLTNTDNPDNLPIADPNAKTKRWGWAYKSTSAASTVTYNVYAAAGKNDISNGYLAGTATYSWDPVTKVGLAQFTIASGIHVEQYQIHIGDSLPSNVGAPGGYVGCAQTFSSTNPPELLSFSCKVNNIKDLAVDGIWFISHIESCKQNGVQI